MQAEKLSFSCSHIIEKNSLKDLLQTAREYVMRYGLQASSQKGFTWSLNNVLLTWKNPAYDNKRYVYWSKKDDGWYQNVFVKKIKSNRPDLLAKKGELLFPYKYAQRSRYHDSGWGMGLAVVKAFNTLNGAERNLLKSKESFIKYIELAGESVHVQNVLSILIWWGKKGLVHWMRFPKELEELAQRSQFDVIDLISKEVKNSPQTRRAITPSLMYTTDYLLRPMMGVPPYQNFQLLPGEKTTPLSSLHWHRSLDTSGGAQLDFNHDYEWLSYSCKNSGRSMGSISIVVGNLHLYAKDKQGITKDIIENDSIENRLCMWTDGYKAGEGVVKSLLKQENYIKNIDRIYALLKNA